MSKVNKINDPIYPVHLDNFLFLISFPFQNQYLSLGFKIVNLT